MLVNASFWALGMEDAIKPDLNIAFVGPFQPNTFNGGGYARGVKPEMYAGFESPIPAIAHHQGRQAAGETGAEESRARQGRAREEGRAADKRAADRRGARHRASRRASSASNCRATSASSPSPKWRCSAAAKTSRRSGKAKQSSTMGYAVAARAIDGNKDPDFNKSGPDAHQQFGREEPVVGARSRRAARRSRRSGSGTGAAWRAGSMDSPSRCWMRIAKRSSAATRLPAPESIEIDVQNQGRNLYLTYDGKAGKPAAERPKSDRGTRRKPADRPSPCSPKCRRITAIPSPSPSRKAKSSPSSATACPTACSTMAGWRRSSKASCPTSRCASAT